MGTNYYLQIEACPCCKRGKEQLHIGKSSAGWAFALHVTDDLPDWKAWATRLVGATIKDEYGNDVTVEEMVKTITERHSGLHRHTVDGGYCVGNGPGTYDYLSGEFS